VSTEIRFPHVDWRDIAAIIPEDYVFDGASSPLRIFYPILYSRYTRALITIAARVHDFGYKQARLPGSPSVPYKDHTIPLYALTKDQWDDVYHDALLKLGHPRIARLHHWVLSKLGHFAWKRNAKRMEKQGWRRYQDWVDSRVE